MSVEREQIDPKERIDSPDDSSGSDSGKGENLDRVLAFFAGVAAATTYYLTLPASIDFGRSADMAATLLGADPSLSGAGLLWGPWGRAWLAILPTETTQGLHLISLIAVALASVTIYLLASRAIRYLSDGRNPGYGGGIIAALSFAWLDTIWSTATTVAAEAPGTLCGLIGLLFVLRWYRRGRPWHIAAGLLMILVGGLLTWQVFSLLTGVGLLVWFRFNSTTTDPLIRPRHVAAGIGAGVGLCLLWLVAATYLGPTEERRLDIDEIAESVTEEYLTEGEDPGARRRVGHFYTRYLLWNLVGRMSDDPEAPSLLFKVSTEEHRRYIASAGDEESFPVLFYALPFLLVLIGVVRHVRRDWRVALALVSTFLAAGPLLAVAAPEGSLTIDRFFALSFAFPALWIGIGAGGVAGWIVRMVQEEGEPSGERDANLRRGALLIAFVVGPVNLVYNGWGLHDRHGTTFAEDFAANMLMSCEENGLLLVEGHDLGGALVYVQASSGIRPDVFVVELSRLGSPHYRSIVEARAEMRGWDREIWEDGSPASYRRDRIAPGPNVSEHDDTAVGGGAGEPMMAGGDTVVGAVDDTAEAPFSVSLHFTRTETTGFDTITWEPTGLLSSSGERLYLDEHIALERLIATAVSDRPVCFAVTVDSDWWSGLDRWFVWTGLVYRLVPKPDSEVYAGPTSVSRYPVDSSEMARLLRGEEGFRLEGLDNRSRRYRPLERRLVRIYRRAWLALAAITEEGGVLEEMDRTVSLYRFPMNYWTAAATAILANERGPRELVEKYARHAVEQADALGESWRTDPVAREYNPYQITATMQALLGDYEGAIERYRSLANDPQSDPVIRGLIEELRIERHLSKGDTASALNELEEIIHGYEGASGTGLLDNRDAWIEYLKELKPPDAQR